MEALSQFFLASLVNSGVYLGRILRKSVRTFSRNVYFVRKKLVIINTLLTLLSLKRVINLLETISSYRGEFMIIDSVYFAHEVYEFPELMSGAVLYNARWVGGLLSNYKLVWKELYLDTLREPKFKHFLPIITSITQRMRRLPSVVFVSNRQYGLYPMKEASSLLIPVISLLNSSTKVNWAMYWLPANDKSVYSLKFFFELFDYIFMLLKLRRLALLRNKLQKYEVKKLLWLKQMSKDPLWDSYRNYDVIKISSQNRKNSSELLKKFKIVTSNLNSNKVVRIKKFGKLSKPRLVKKIKSITKFKIFDRLARKKRIYRQIRKLQIKERLSKAKKSKVSKKNKILQHVKRKKSKIKRFRKSWILKKNKRKRASRLYKRRRFLSRSRNRRFKNNRKKSRKKLILRYREVTRARFPRKVVFMSSRKPLKLANRKLLIKLFKYTDVTHRKSNLFFRRKINKKWAIRKFIKKASRSPRIIRIINTPKGVKVIFAGISYKLNKLLLKQYINKSSVFLKMTGEEKLAYLDKLSISLEEKMKLLQM